MCRSPSDVAGGNGAASNDQVGLGEADYRNMGADPQAAIAKLTGDFATDKPEIQSSDFPGPVAEAAYWDDGSIVGLQGPVGSGKTTTMLKSRIRRACYMPRSTRTEKFHGITGNWRRYKLLVIRETYRQLWSTTIPDFLHVYPKDMGEWVGGRGGPVTYTMIFQDAYGPIEFIAEFMAFGDDIVASLRGYHATDIWLHEMDTNPQDVLVNAVTRMNRWPDKASFEGYAPEFRDYGQIIGDFNAPEEDNWCNQFFADPAERARIVNEMNRSLSIEAEKTGADFNPIQINYHRQPGFGEPGCENLQNLGAGYYPTAIAAQKLAGRGDLVERLIRNKVTVMKVGEPVFEREFNEAIHVRNMEPDRDQPLLIGLDQGFRGAAVIGQFHPRFHWRIFAELMFPDRRMMAVAFARKLRDLLDEIFPGMAVEAAWGDMAGEQGSSLGADENATWNRLVGKEAGFKVRPQKIGTNRIQPRLEAIRAPLEYLDGGEPGLLIHPRCVHMIRGFKARYVWAEEVGKHGEKRKVPDKSHVEANVMDAAQYLLLSKAKPDGTSPISSRQQNSAPGQLGHNGGPPLASHGGLQTNFDVLNPYGETR
ncbi:hypothetical protein [Roseobacter sp. N2S]|uniref:hypothetical protein n=1 Tax=Roseobacter sp. N2S TaxID=2663844 RepID=UPI0028621544|nr:hypothetical protein [Roseobacter sp. N2S]MDR6266549.1 hypothetical protein [Roseobacter sp. N2S]